MPHQQTIIQTKDGNCPAHVLTPAGDGPWPAVIFFMDGLGIRPTLIDMGQRLADAGYLVLLPDMFYRFGRYEPLVPKEIFQGDVRAAIGPMMATTGNQPAAEDAQAYLSWLDARTDVAGPKIGVVGFCMGGGMALTIAGTYPGRVAAAASYHGGQLATDDPASPHLLAPQMKGEIYVAGADNDPSYPPDMAVRLEQALTGAGVRHRTEIYAGAAHGWMKMDFPVYDEVAAERGWREMLALFARNLR